VGKEELLIKVTLIIITRDKSKMEKFTAEEKSSYNLKKKKKLIGVMELCFKLLKEIIYKIKLRKFC
jgi:hypothetical protein